MDFILRLKANIKRNTNLWIALWVLILINIFTSFTLSWGFSWWVLICFILLGLLGAGILKIFAQVDAEEVKIEIPPQIIATVNETMEEIKPLCDEIFDKVVNTTVDPVIDDLRKDFLKGLTWLWENNEEYINSIEHNMSDVDTIVRLFRSMTEEKYNLIADLRNSVGSINEAIMHLRTGKGEDFSHLTASIDEQRDELWESLGKEREIFYDYVNKLLIEQSQTVEDFNPAEHFDIYKLGEQFAGIMEKSLQARLPDFHEKAIGHLEDFSSDVVGKMQKNVTRLLNVFRDNQTILERFNYECRGESHLLLNRIDELIEKNLKSQEKANEILLSLAWQEILVEKRWQEIKSKLYIIKEFVQHNTEESVHKFIKELVDKEITGMSYMIKPAEGALFYKNLLDAELTYQVYISKSLGNINNEGAQVLLLFIYNIEMLANSSIRLNEQGIRMRKDVRRRAKNGEFDTMFKQIKTLVEADKPGLQDYLDDIFPADFYSFCNSPYVKKKPDNLNTAAWSLFLGLIEQESNENLYILIGLLLIAHKFRNKYIHPLKNSLLELQNEDEIEQIRYIAYRIINLIIHHELKGITNLSYKYK